MRRATWSSELAGRRSGGAALRQAQVGRAPAQRARAFARGVDAAAFGVDATGIAQSHHARQHALHRPSVTQGLLHARFDGQIKSFQVAAWSIAAFWTILMTYLGVNFVLASGLHSYGFGSSSLVRSMTIVAVVEAAFLLAGAMAHRRRLAALAA